MTSATPATTDAPAPRSTLNFLSLACLCLTAAFLTASVFLILQYKKGIPFEFITSVVLAAAAALVLPIIASVLFRRYVTQLTYPGMVGFLSTNLIIAVVTGVLIF